MSKHEPMFIYSPYTNRLVSNPKYKPINLDIHHISQPDFISRPESVEHPQHYNTGNIEVLDVIADWLTGDELRGFIKGNVLKYVARERHKNGLEDLKKARFYLDWLIKNEEAKQ